MKKITLSLIMLAMPMMSHADLFEHFSPTAKAAVFAEEESCGTPKFAPHETEKNQAK